MADKRDVLDLIYDRPVEIGHWVGFRDLTDLHNGWLQDFLFGREDETLLAHRGSYKTSVLSLYLAIHSVIRPNESVIYFRKTDTNVQDVNKQTVNILQSGAMRRIGMILYDRPLIITKATATEISTGYKTAITGQAQVSGFGIGSSITGKHSDIVITDDIVTQADRVSRAEREKTKLAYQELENIKNRGGRILNCGTPWHKEDAISTLMPNVKRYDCYQTGLMTVDQIHALQGKMTPSLFAANYELRHIADQDALFDSPRWHDGAEADIYGGICHIDAAYGGSDYTAFTVLKQVPGGYIGYGKIWQKHVDECLPEIKALHRRFRAGTISCENNGDKGYLAKEIQRNGLPARTYAERQNKYIKISTHLKAAWADIRWIADTDPGYLGQIMDYTENAEHDDAPDSAASLVRIMGTAVRFNNTAGL